MNLPGAKSRLKILMIQRGIKPREVAAGTGLTLNYTYRILNELVVSRAGRRRVEAFLGAPIWSVTNPTPGDTSPTPPDPVMDNTRFQTGASGHESAQVRHPYSDPALDNFNPRWCEALGKLKRSVICIQMEKCPLAFKQAEFVERLAVAFKKAGLGHFDEPLWQPEIRLFYYARTEKLSPALEFLNSKLAQQGLSAIYKIGFWDTQSKLWRQFYPGADVTPT